MPRCLNCKKKFEAEHFNQKFCLQSEDCLTAFRIWAKKQRQKQWRKEKSELKKELETKPQLEKKLEKEVNTIARLIDKGHSCISHEGSLGKNYDAGHFYSVKSAPTIRFHLFNIYAQCVQCNHTLSGNLFEYYQRLESVFNKELQEYVTSLKSHEPIHLTKAELREKIVIARKVVKKLKSKDLTYSMKERLEIRIEINNKLNIYDY